MVPPLKTSSSRTSKSFENGQFVNVPSFSRDSPQQEWNQTVFGMKIPENIETSLRSSMLARGMNAPLVIAAYMEYFPIGTSLKVIQYENFTKNKRGIHGWRFWGGQVLQTTIGRMTTSKTITDQFHSRSRLPSCRMKSRTISNNISTDLSTTSLRIGWEKIGVVYGMWEMMGPPSMTRFTRSWLFFGRDASCPIHDS